MGLLHVYVLRSVYHCLWWCGFASCAVYSLSYSMCTHALGIFSAWIVMGCVLLNEIDWYDTIDWKKSLDMASVSCVLTYENEMKLNEIRIKL